MKLSTGLLCGVLGFALSFNIVMFAALFHNTLFLAAGFILAGLNYLAVHRVAVLLDALESLTDAREFIGE